jgi:hypothetical protein
MAPEDDVEPGVVDDELKVHGIHLSGWLMPAYFLGFQQHTCKHPLS